VSDLAPLAKLANLQSLSCSATKVSDLAPLAKLANLQSLTCPATKVNDLAPLAKLATLQSLSCSATKVSDLAPLAALVNLQSLACSSTQVSDLAPLAALANLRSLFCSSTQVNDLAPLAALANLRSLDCPGTLVSDLTPLAALVNLQSLNCWETQVSDIAPLAALVNLQSLSCSATQVNDLAPLAALVNLQSLACSSTQVSDLAPLAALVNLQSLDCSETRVNDLAPLAALVNLQSLDCPGAPVSDLTPLAALVNLQSLNCWETPVSDLTPLAALVNLQSLSFSATQVSDLAPLAALVNLLSLDCSETQVNDLTPLAALVNLQSLYCSETQVNDLTPLAALVNLQSLYCSETQVGDLIPLTALNLQSLDCSGTQVRDLGPLATLANLRLLYCAGCRLAAIPDSLLQMPSLQFLLLHETSVPGVPAEVLSQTPDDDCLLSLRAHRADLAGGAEAMPDVKLMVLGNGRVGKTQMCRRLCGEDYDEKVESTHGIIVRPATLSRAGAHDTAQLQIWDFGGQDIYHGTHALFMRSRAVFALVWIPEAEKTPEHLYGGFTYRNQPLAYWLDYVRQFGGAGSPVLIVQTRCDKAEDEAVRPPVTDETLGALAFRRIVHYSANNDRGRPTLDDALFQSVDWLRDKEGISLIGAGRAMVKRRIEEMRDADMTRPPLEKMHRTINYTDFLALCEKTGGISDPKQLLVYLHNTGAIFYHEGLFEDRIIIDQSWALESIYAVFHREKCYRRILRQNGRFTRSDLAEWIWNEAGHGVKEQELLLSMMQSCGICFQHRSASLDGSIEAEYIAPELLPERSDSDITQKWDADRQSETAEFEYPLLPQALMRGIISHIGSEAGLAADYWRGGVYVYEATTGSRGQIEQKMTGPWRGQITVQTQRGQAAALLERLVKLVEHEQGRIGVVAAGKQGSLKRTTERGILSPAASEIEAKPPLRFTQELAAQPEYFVSYAWGDDTPEGKKREEVVDRLCAAAEERGITILRDKKTLGLGDRISKFMNRIGAGNRVFVVLSEKYLKSPYCMYELTEVWRNCMQDEHIFLDRIRIITLPDANIFKPQDRGRWGAYWKQESEGLRAVVDGLGKKDLQQYGLMKDFSHVVGDILYAIADVVQPSSDDDFEEVALRYFFEDPRFASPPAPKKDRAGGA
jgi:internalin A